MLESPAAVIALLSAVCAFFFWLERRTEWAVFRYFPPLLFIYALPVVLRNTGVLPATSAAYDALGDVVLPSFLVLMLVGIDVRAAFEVAGRGIVVMLAGSAGIVLGAVVSYALVASLLPPDAWKQFGALSGAWIGGTGNMAAVAGGMGLEPSDLGVAILADNVIYVVWLPILLSSRTFADRFNRWARVDPERVRRLEQASVADTEPRAITLVDILYLIAITAAIVWVSARVADMLPTIEPVLSHSTWRTLVITTLALAVSFTPARDIPGSRAAGLALVYLFLAGMGARASLGGLTEAPVFLAACFLWIAIHGAFLLLAARLLRVDIHTAAIASAANIGGAASAPVVAAHHRESLVPISILMALMGYAAGNYLAVLTSQLCWWVAPG